MRVGLRGRSGRGVFRGIGRRDVFLGGEWRREIGEEGEGRGEDERENSGKSEICRGDGSWRGMLAEVEREEEMEERLAGGLPEMEGMAVQRSGGSGGGGLSLRRRFEDSGVAMMAEKNRGRGKEWRRSSRRRRWRHGCVRRRRLDSFPGLP